MGIKRGENQHQSTSCVRSIQCYCSQSKMNYLCAVLLLAFAAGSVHSSFWVYSQYYKEVFESTFKEQCGRHFPQKIPYVSLLSPIKLSLGSTLNQVTGVSMDMVDVSVTLEDFTLNITINIILGCNSFWEIEASIEANADLSPTLKDGCVVLDSSDLSVSLSLNGQVLSVNKHIIDKTLGSIKEEHVIETVKDILDNVLLSLNCLAKSFNSVQIICGQPCQYQIREAKIVGGLLQGVCCFHTEEGSECSENVDVPMYEDAVSTIRMTNGMLSSLMKMASGGVILQLQVPDKIWGDLVITFGSPGHLRLSITGIDSSSFTPNGAEANVSISAELFTDTESIISANANLDMTAEINCEHNFWGFTFQARTSVDLDLNVKEDTCECWDSISTWLPNYLTCNVNGVVDLLNAHLDLCLKVPNPGGMTHPNVVVTPGQDFCDFKWSK